MNASYRLRNFVSNMFVRNMQMNKEIYIKKKKDEKYIPNLLIELNYS